MHCDKRQVTPSGTPTHEEMGWTGRQTPLEQVPLVMFAVLQAAPSGSGVGEAKQVFALQMPR